MKQIIEIKEVKNDNSNMNENQYLLYKAVKHN